MSIADKRLDAITEQDLLDLIAEEEPEGRRIDYKRDLYSSSDADKFEFRFDVASFANAGGGDLVFGMTEENRLPVDLPGIDGLNEEELRLTLSQILDHKIWPRLSGVEMHAIQLKTGKHAFIVRVPSSWSAPHSVEVKDRSFKFAIRNADGRQYMDGFDVRRAIQSAESRTERLRSFREERVRRITKSNTTAEPTNTPIGLPVGIASIILHLIPLSAFDGVGFDLKVFQDKRNVPTVLRAVFQQGHYNFDGFVEIAQGPRAEDFPRGYIQIYRSGILEIVDTELFQGYSPAINIFYERELIQMLPVWLSTLKLIGATGPVAVGLTILNVAGWVCVPDDAQTRNLGFGRENSHQVLLAPEVLEDSLDFDPATTLRPAFDVIWNAFGWPRAMTYDEDGKRLGFD